ncbi:hypothetical protein TI39_contig269g00014 [Zymoseptoria brevis]|uniref:Uncharacterized protein n=1 Tax=Zymoseptoria brevis TaxID=1047168 RepID=A0A0F4GY66_9PEZI|nr:hypothetical protein TI39_contig269g00014 [Zymoseptoria brevis]
MDTTSLVLNGRTTNDVPPSCTQERRSSILRSFSTPMLPSLSALNAVNLAKLGSAPSSPTFSGASTPRRPGSARSNSSGWYTPNENNLTLEDFAKRLKTRSKRLEIWQGRCAQNIVMALLRPTPLVLFLFNPVCLLMVWICVMVWWMSSPGRGIE